MTDFTPEILQLDENNIVFVLPRGNRRMTREITRLDAQILVILQECAAQWPEEDAESVKALQASMLAHPEMIHWVACETVFFNELPQPAADYALPQSLLEKGYRRYGGDGLLVHWTAQLLTQYSSIVVVHLGDTPTVAAVQHGRAVDCSQGYSAVEGLPSCTVCGTIDPSIVLLLSENGYSPAEIADILYHRSGWGEHLHLVDLLNARDEHSRMLRDHVLDALAKAVGEAFSALGAPDAALVLLLDEPLQAAEWVQEFCDRFAFAGFGCSTSAVEENGWTRYSTPGSTHVVLSHTADRAQVLRELCKNR